MVYFPGEAHQDEAYGQLSDAFVKCNGAHWLSLYVIHRVQRSLVISPFSSGSNQ